MLLMRVAGLKWRGVVRKGADAMRINQEPGFVGRTEKLDIPAEFIKDLQSYRNSTRSGIKSEKGHEAQNFRPGKKIESISFRC